MRNYQKGSGVYIVATLSVKLKESNEIYWGVLCWKWFVMYGMEIEEMNENEEKVYVEIEAFGWIG